MSLKMRYKKIFIILIVNLFYLHAANANQRITIGAKLLAAGWQGDNGSVSNSFNSDEGGQIAISASYSLDKFYAGVSLQNGKYKFNDSAPEQFTQSGRVNTSNTNIEHNELDILTGYYIWDNISFFIDLKGISNIWSNNDYEQNFGGLGFGVSGFLPLKNNLTLFGSAGFVGNGDIKDSAEVKVGNGSSGALDLGTIFKLTPNSSLNVGLKFRTYNFEYLDNTSQEYSINALFVGYNHSFTLE